MSQVRCTSHTSHTSGTIRTTTGHASTARPLARSLQVLVLAATAIAGIGAASVSQAQDAGSRTAAASAAKVPAPQPRQAQQPQLDVKFACSAEDADDRLRDGDRRLLADSGAFHLHGDTVLGFYWESSVFRSHHGADCSIDESDELVAEALPQLPDAGQRWRIGLRDGRAARTRRGYDADHGVNCSVRIARLGEQLQIVPSCPALCGSRENFSRLTVDLRTGSCAYEH